MQKAVIQKSILWIIILLCTIIQKPAEASFQLQNFSNPFVSDGAVELVRYNLEFSAARIEPAQYTTQAGIAVIFEGTKNLHYYANTGQNSDTISELTVHARSDSFEFGQTIYPIWEMFTDITGLETSGYAGNFTVFIPITEASTEQGNVEVTITGPACSGELCIPFEKTLQTTIDWSQRQEWTTIEIELPPAGPTTSSNTPTLPIWFALPLALLAGLALNIMPCVWPVLPIIVLRIVSQSKDNRRKSTMMGFAFCMGILSFFAILAGANIVLQLFFDTVLQWGEQFRNTTFVAGMSLLLVLLAMFMFGAFNITLPAAVTGKSASGKGYFAAAGTGLLAAVLSTPCSFGILAAAFAWAQSQPLLLATTAIMFIGIGMALPYAILTSIPALIERLPKPGRWMELFKQSVGFILLIIAVKLIISLPEARLSGILYFAVVLSFCAWMWGSWISFGTKPSKKWLVRFLAIALAVTAGWTFLPAGNDGLIEWQDYNAVSIKDAILQERPVLLKFTADWCMICPLVDRAVYSKKEIAELIKQKNILAIKADTTEDTFQASIDLKQIYNEPGVPVSILLIPGSEEPIKWRGIFFADKLREKLEVLPDRQIE